MVRTSDYTKNISNFLFTPSITQTPEKTNDKREGKTEEKQPRRRIEADNTQEKGRESRQSKYMDRLEREIQREKERKEALCKQVGKLKSALVTNKVH